MEFVEVMEKAQEMCKDFSVCSNCPIYYPGPSTCWHTLFFEPEKAINDYIFRRTILMEGKENAAL